MSFLQKLKSLPSASDTTIVLYLIALSGLFFVPFLGSTHLFDWDEINFAECAREMIATGDYFRPQIDYEPFWEKPPLFIWMQAAAMHLFGVGEFAARFPNALGGLATLLFVYFAGSRHQNRNFGLLWAMAWLGSVLPHFYFRSGIIDPWFNLFIFAGLWLFFEGKSKTWMYSMIGGLLCGLAILTKGPVAYLVSAATVGILVLWWRKWSLIPRFLLFSVAAATVPMLWFGADIALHGTWFVREFITYNLRLAATEDSGHGGFLGYHFVVLFFGCFPVSIFALSQLVSWQKKSTTPSTDPSKSTSASAEAETNAWNRTLFWIVLILFSLVQTKIVHYSSLCYFPLTYLATVQVQRLLYGEATFSRGQTLLFMIPVLTLGLSAAMIPYLGQNLHLIRPLFERDLSASGQLEAVVPWAWTDALPGVLLLLFGALAAYFLWKKNAQQGISFAYVGGMVFTALAVILLTPRIESITQRSAIEFFKSKIGEDCIIQTSGFKSYAHLYYSQKRPIVGDPKKDDRDWLLREDFIPEKPVYFVARTGNLRQMQEHPHMEELYRKNGYVFYRLKK